MITEARRRDRPGNGAQAGRLYLCLPPLPPVRPRFMPPSRAVRKRRFWSQLRAAARKPRRWSWSRLWDLSKRLAIRFVIGLFALASAERLSDASPSYAWGWFSAIALVGALLDLAKDSVSVSRASERGTASRITLNLLSGAIDDLRRKPNGTEAHVQTLLTRIERTAEAFLSEAGVEHGELTANLMVVEAPNSYTKQLRLKYWGTRREDREPITLALSKHPTLPPGAPTAFFERRVVYVHDTQADPYRTYFESPRPYRSFLSVPIPFSKGGGDIVRAVLNLDSTAVDGFEDDEFVVEELLPALRPWLGLLAMERDL